MSARPERETAFTTQASDDDLLERPPRRSTVVIGIAAASILLVTIVGFLLYRALAHGEPSHVALIQGNAAWLGAELIVSGASLPHPYVAVLNKSDRYSVPFFVGRGDYTAVARVGGQEVFRLDFRLDRNRVEHILLPEKVPSTAPARGG